MCPLLGGTIAWQVTVFVRGQITDPAMRHVQASLVVRLSEGLERFDDVGRLEGMSSLFELAMVQHIRRAMGQHRPGSAAKAPPGWFYDPRKIARYRYWTGTNWTDDTAEDLPGVTRPD